MPPHNAGYYHVAYALASVIYAGYAVLLYVRWKNIRSGARTGAP